MNRLEGVNLRIALLPCLVALILAESLILSKAASSAPEATGRDKALTETKSARGSAKGPKQLVARTKASSSTVPASDAQSTRRAAARSDDYHKEIAALQARLERQEQLLAAQQQQIEKPVATVDELKGQPNRSLLVADASGVGGEGQPVLRLASYNPGTAPKLEDQAAISHHQIPPAAVKSQDPLASAGSITPKASEPFPLTASTSSPPFMPANVTGLAPAASAIQTSAPSNSTANQNVTQPTSQDQTQPYVTRLDTLSRQVEGISKGVAGFRFSGDLRLRGDGIFRSSDKVAGPEQNVRGQYRARLNLDKGIDPQLNVHFQLGSGRFDKPRHRLPATIFWSQSG